MFAPSLFIHKTFQTSVNAPTAVLYCTPRQMNWAGDMKLSSVSCNKDPVGQADEVKKPTWVENPHWIQAAAPSLVCPHESVPKRHVAFTAVYSLLKRSYALACFAGRLWNICLWLSLHRFTACETHKGKKRFTGWLQLTCKDINHTRYKASRQNTVVIYMLKKSC